MWRLLALGVMVLSIMAAVGGFAYHQRELGAQTVRAELAEAKAKQAEEDKLIALQGKAAVLRLLRTAEQRNRAADAQAASDALARRVASDARAKEDREYALWREQPVPDFVAQRLRDLTLIAAHEPSRGVVPGGTPVPTDASIPANLGAADQSIAGRIRAALDRANPARVEQGGSSGK